MSDRVPCKLFMHSCWQPAARRRRYYLQPSCDFIQSPLSYINHMVSYLRQRWDCSVWIFVWQLLLILRYCLIEPWSAAMDSLYSKNILLFEIIFIVWCDMSFLLLHCHLNQRKAVDLFSAFLCYVYFLVLLMFFSKYSWLSRKTCLWNVLFCLTYLRTCLGVAVVAVVFCRLGGVVPLLHCGICPASYHISCLPPNARASFSTGIPWVCPGCKSGRKPLYGDIVWVKYSNYRLTDTYITKEIWCLMIHLRNKLGKLIGTLHSGKRNLACFNYVHCVPIRSHVVLRSSFRYFEILKKFIE